MTSLYEPAIALFAALLLISVLGPKSDRLRIHTDEFGRTKQGELIHRYPLRNKNGVEAAIVNYGTTLVTLKVPDRDGHLSDVVLGYDDLKSYEEGKSYFGASLGRYSNRIAKGEFWLCTNSNVPVTCVASDRTRRPRWCRLKPKPGHERSPQGKAWSETAPVRRGGHGSCNPWWLAPDV
jgi:Aldose 1-epimerase